MIRSVVTFINNFAKQRYVSAVVIAQGRDASALSTKLEKQFESERKARLAEESFRVQIANMGKTEAELYALKRNWLNQTTDMTVQQYAETLEILEDKLEQQRQERSRQMGHL